MYSPLFELHAELLKALAHPRRLEIIHLLREHELPVSDIHTMLDLPQANISQHLMVLRDAGAVTTRREGKQVYYSLTSPRIFKACDTLRDFLIDQLPEDQVPLEAKMKMQELLPLVHDPVCKMRVSPKTAGFSHTHNHHQYYFCASGCLAAFTQEPARYVSSS